MDMTPRSRTQAKQALKGLKPTCGDCSGLKCEKLIEKNKGFCSANGKTKQSEPCKFFQPDVRPVQALIGTDGFEALVSLVRGMPSDALRSLATLLYAEKKVRRLGFYFGQKVYVRYRGTARSDYMSNFMLARVLTVQGDYIKVSSKDGKCVATFMYDNIDRQVYDVDRFDTLRTKMVRKGNLVDPDITYALTKRFRCIEEYELGITTESKGGTVTTIDTVFKEGKLPRRGGKDTVKTIELVEIVDGIIRGYDMSKEAKKYKQVVPGGKGKGKGKTTSSGDTVIDVSGD